LANLVITQKLISEMGEEINVETYPLSRRHGQSEKIKYIVIDRLLGKRTSLKL
jgi:hypothetical protein